MDLTIWLWLFIAGVAGVFYTYIGYPIFLIVTARLLKRKVKKEYTTPSVSFLIVAHNEDWVIRKKLRNTLGLNYPAEKMEIVVASDGSDDKTENVVKEFSRRGVRLISYKKRIGKTPVINRTIPQLNGEIVVFSDSREMFHQDAVKELVANFTNPKVGAVSGELILTDRKKEAVGKSIRLYWEYEKRLRKREGEISSSVGATGAIYAIRRNLFKPIPKVTILDDLAIPMVIIAQGYRVIFDRTAKAYDDVSGNSRQEYGRKSRTMAGNFQILFNLGRKYHFKNLFVLFEYFSHKVSRVLLPGFFTLVFISSLMVPFLWIRVFFICQAAFYGLALIGLLTERLGKKGLFIFHFPAVFCTLHFAIVVGFFRYALHRQSHKWESMVRGKHRPE